MAAWAAGAALVAAGTLTLVGCCCSRPVTLAEAQPPRPPTAADTAAVPREVPSPPDSVTRAEMQDVHLRIDPTLALHIYRLRGTMQPRPGFEVIAFGNPRSFVIDIRSARVGLSGSNLRYLLNQYVFDYPGAPLTLHEITVREEYIHQRGTLHNIVDIPFEMTAELSVTSEGLIRLHPTEMTICEIPGKGLMKAVGVQLDELLDLTKAQGVTVEGNDLLLNPTQLLPPPAIRGDVTAVRLEGDQVIQIFGAPGDTTRRIAEFPTPPDPKADNYMFFRGGLLRFGKLYMRRADLQIIDADPSDIFDFFLQQYKAQLVAGASRIAPDFGLKTYVPDYDEVGPTAEEPERIPIGNR